VGGGFRGKNDLTVTCQPLTYRVRYTREVDGTLFGFVQEAVGLVGIGQVAISLWPAPPLGSDRTGGDPDGLGRDWGRWVPYSIPDNVLSRR
jgi:hypothetical protein